MTLIAELKRRNVIRMAGLYLVGAWLAVQVAATLLPVFEAPGWVMKALVVLLAMGFVAAVVFAWVFELTPEGLKRDADVPVSESIAPQTARRLDRGIIVVLLLALGYFAFDKFALTPKREVARMAEATQVVKSDAAPTSATSSPAASVASEKSIAVLAFANMSADKDNEYFSDGVAEEIMGALAKIEAMKVAGRTSSFYFKGRNDPLSVIGATLGVAHVLEGSVRKQGERLRISTKLLRVSDGVELWAETFDGTDADVFALQEGIAQQVARQLQVALDAGQQDRLVNTGTTNPEAYALYLQAGRIFNRREGARYDDAIAMLEQAIALDAGYARALSRLAAIYAVYGNYRSGKSATARRMVEQHARRASELDPTLAEPYAALGNSLNQNRRYLESRKALERALQLDPNDVTANFWHATDLIITGYIREGNAALDRTLALDPLLPNALLWRGDQHVLAGELEPGERLLRRAAEVGHVFVGIGQRRLDMARGDQAAAIASLTQGLAGYFTTEFPPGAPGVFARSMHRDAQAREQAMAMIDTYLATRPETIDGIVPYVLIGSGEVGRALQLVQDRATSNESLYLFELFRRDSEINGAPGFPEFARRSGLAGLWDSVGPPDRCRKNAGGDYHCD